MKKVNCSECKYSILIYYEYSDWSVAATDVHCLFEINKKLPVDNLYGQAPELVCYCDIYIKATDEEPNMHADIFMDDGIMADYIPLWAHELPYTFSRYRNFIKKRTKIR